MNNILQHDRNLTQFTGMIPLFTMGDRIINDAATLSDEGLPEPLKIRAKSTKTKQTKMLGSLIWSD
jgi:hypothetical protein